MIFGPRWWGCALASLTILLAEMAAADPVLLRYTPENGLSVPYDVTLSGSLGMGGAGAPSMNRSFELTGRFEETVTGVRGDRVTLRRKYSKLTAISEGNREDAPQEVMNRVTTFTFDKLGAALNVETTGQVAENGPDPVTMVMGSLVRIPFPEEAVDIGARWDSSKGYRVFSEGMSLEAESTLVGVYESDGMRVALTQTKFNGTGTVPMPNAPGGANMPLRIRLDGAALQSTRLEDGCMLGLRIRFDASATITLPGSGTLEVTMNNIRGEVRVGK